jgi:hypothetical protein
MGSKHTWDVQHCSSYSTEETCFGRVRRDQIWLELSQHTNQFDESEHIPDRVKWLLHGAKEVHRDPKSA